MVDVHFLKGSGGLKNSALSTLLKMVENNGWPLNQVNVSLIIITLATIHVGYFEELSGENSHK